MTGDRYRTPDGWTVEVVQLAAGDRLRIRHPGFYVADIVNALARRIPATELAQLERERLIPVAWPPRRLTCRSLGRAAAHGALRAAADAARTQFRAMGPAAAARERRICVQDGTGSTPAAPGIPPDSAPANTLSPAEECGFVGMESGVSCRLLACLSDFTTSSSTLTTCRRWPGSGLKRLAGRSCPSVSGRSSSGLMRMHPSGSASCRSPIRRRSRTACIST